MRDDINADHHVNNIWLNLISINLFVWCWQYFITLCSLSARICTWFCVLFCCCYVIVFCEFVGYFYLYSSALNHWYWTKDQKSVGKVIPKDACKIDCCWNTANKRNCKLCDNAWVCCSRFKVYEVNVASVINLLWPSNAIWRCRCWSTLARNTKLFYKLMLNYHQSCFVIFN